MKNATASVLLRVLLWSYVSVRLVDARAGRLREAGPPDVEPSHRRGVARGTRLPFNVNARVRALL